MPKGVTSLNIKNENGSFTNVPIAVKAENVKLNNGKKPNPLVTPSSGQAGDYTGKMRKEDNSTEKEIK